MNQQQPDTSDRSNYAFGPGATKRSIDEQIVGKKMDSDTGILNFFRNIVTNKLHGKKKENENNVVSMRPPAVKSRKQILLSTPRSALRAHELQQAARLVQARLQSESGSDWPALSSEKITAPGTIYKYRSKADKTYTNLPAIVINQ